MGLGLSRLWWITIDGEHLPGFAAAYISDVRAHLNGLELPRMAIVVALHLLHGREVVRDAVLPVGSIAPGSAHRSKEEEGAQERGKDSQQCTLLNKEQDTYKALLFLLTLDTQTLQEKVIAVVHERRGLHSGILMQKHGQCAKLIHNKKLLGVTRTIEIKASSSRSPLEQGSHLDRTQSHLPVI